MLNTILQNERVSHLKKIHFTSIQYGHVIRGDPCIIPLILEMVDNKGRGGIGDNTDQRARPPSAAKMVVIKGDNTEGRG